MENQTNRRSILKGALAKVAMAMGLGTIAVALVGTKDAGACGWTVYNQYDGCLLRKYYYYCGAFRYVQCCCVCQGCHQSACYICG